MSVSSDGEVMLIERTGSVAHLRMNRPDVLNVLDEGLAEAMLSAVEQVAGDDTVRAVVLSGAGRSFMAGGDLSRFHADLSGAPQIAGWLIDRFHAVMRTIKSMPKPVVAAVHGPVAGGGVGLALACDLVVASSDTTFLSAYTKLGTSPDGGTTWSLTRLLGPRRALAFMLLNERLDARAAQEAGLFNIVVEPHDVLPAATDMANRLAASAAGAGATVKRLVQAAVTGGFDAQLDLEKQGFVSAAGTADFREGITAFFERRPPRFD